MKCEKCQDRGFVEFEHGLIMQFCDCEKGRALRKEVIGGMPDPDSSYVVSSKNMVLGKNEPIIPLSKMGEIPEDNPKCLIIPEALPGKTIDETADIFREIIEANKTEIADDSSNGDDLNHPITGSDNTSQPKQPRKQKKGKKPARRAR